MKTRIVFASVFLLLSSSLSAQQKWNLKSVVEYAMENNITVKQSEVQAKVSALIYDQSKLSRFPSLGFTANGARYSGITQDATFNRVTDAFFQAQYQLQSSADIFNFFSKNNFIATNKWE